MQTDTVGQHVGHGVMRGEWATGERERQRISFVYQEDVGKEGPKARRFFFPIFFSYFSVVRDTGDRLCVM